MRARSSASGSPPTHMTPIATGMATTANATRRASSDTRLGRHAAEAPLAVLEVEDRLEQLAPAEVRPEDARDEELRVGELPEQEVRDAHLPRRADEEVGVGAAGGEEPGGQVVFGDLLGDDAAL